MQGTTKKQRRLKHPKAERLWKSRMWAEMAPDVLTNIFLRLPSKQCLLDIPCVCKPWKLASQDPLCWQKLNFEFWKTKKTFHCADLIARILQRCQGCLQQLTLPLIPDRHTLDLLARSAPLLEKLDISGSCADDEWATYAAPLMPRITDLNLSFSSGKLPHCKLSHLALEAFGRSCKGITKLMWRSYADKNRTGIDDSEAFAIARHYPRLRHLELESNSVSTQGLRAILDNCPELEYLDVKDCPNLKNMDATLLSLCRSRLKYFVEPATSHDNDGSIFKYYYFGPTTMMFIMRRLCPGIAIDGG